MTSELLLAFGAPFALIALMAFFRRHASRRPVWPRLAGWWASSVMFTWVLWSLAASAHFVSTQSHFGAEDYFRSILTTAVWAPFGGGGYIAIYALMITIYGLWFGREQGGFPDVMVAVAVLAVPGAGWWLYVHKYSSLEFALPGAALLFLCVAAGLFLPRLLFRALGPGRLVYCNAA